MAAFFVQALAPVVMNGAGRAMAVNSLKTLSHLKRLHDKGTVTILVDEKVGKENVLLYRTSTRKKLQFDTYTGDSYEGSMGEALPISIGLLKTQPRLIALLKRAIVERKITAAACCEAVTDGSWIELEQLLGPIEPAAEVRASHKIRD